MAPRKGKKKADSDSEEHEEHEDGSQETNMFRFDTRPVEAEVPVDELATKVKRLDAALAKARIGIGKMNILELQNTLKFGVYNDRAQKTSEVNKMMSSFEKHGMQAYTDGNALPIIIQRSRLSPGQTFEGDWNDPETLTEVQLEDSEPIVLASGQHRVAALKKIYNTFVEEEATQTKRLKRLQGLQTVTDEHVEEHAVLRERIAKVLGHIGVLGQWGVILYDEEMILADGVELARHLSRNQTLHVYSETHEEVLVSTFRNLYDEYQRAGLEATVNMLQLEFKKPMNEKNSKLTRIFKNTRMVVTLVRDLLPMGLHYRYRRELSVGWLAQNISVVMGMYAIYMSKNIEILRFLASKDKYITYAEADELVRASAEDDRAGEDALKRLPELRDQILKSTPGDPKIFAPYFEDFDKAATKSFHLYDGTLGTWNVDYEGALEDYRDAVCTTLRTAWYDRSEEDAVWLDSVRARVTVWLTAIPRKHMPMPLMTSMVMDKVWDELEAVQEGYMECTRWFEPIVDTMKVNVSHSHAVDDCTEALFRAIERERGMQTEEAVNAVWSALWEGRSSTVLQLHNTMSELEMQKKMGERPKTKDEFAFSWVKMSETTKKNMTALYNAIKPLVGKGPKDMPLSSMKVTGMQAVMITGWDWQRKHIQKQITREVLPSIQAIMMEMAFAATYRGDILAEPMIRSLRATLKSIMTAKQKKSRLTSATAGALAQRKTWDYWDGIEAPDEANVEAPEPDEDAQTKLNATRKRLKAEKTDRDAIIKLQGQIMALGISRNTPHKKSPVSQEVADAINILTEALSMNASRIRLRILSGLEHHEFDPALHHTDLKIPAVDGQRDLNTVSKLTKRTGEKDKDEDMQDSDDDIEINDVPPPSTKSKSKKSKSKKSKGDKKGKGKEKVRMIEDAEDIPDDGIDVDTDPQDSMAQAAAIVKNTERPKPKPKPVARKKATADAPESDTQDAPESDTQDAPESDTQDAPESDTQDVEMADIHTASGSASANIEAALDASVHLHDALNHIDLDAPGSPLTSPTPEDGDVNMPGEMQLTTASNLTADLDAMDGMRRSSRAKQQPIPRAAPTSTRTAAASTSAPARSAPKSSRARGAAASTSASVRSSVAPSETSTGSKRSRQDALLTSPKIKKKARHSLAQRLFEESDDNDVVDRLPDM
ncbi:hypothetical protein DFH29DRAFT_1003872 [Suillus ampliporus]|nr:hypothetical protein DFH29DRAFT_1003872 [Suillus ampliporus]